MAGVLGPAGAPGSTGIGAGELRAQLDRARIGLQQIERDIRKASVQHGGNRSFDKFENKNSRGGPRLSNKPGLNQEGPDQRDRGLGLDGRLNNKRPPQETKTVFSRLSAKVPGDSDNEEDVAPSKKPRVSSQVTRDLPTKQEVLKAQEGDEQSKARNRRIFGSLLGTLQKFKQEAIILQNKEDKKARVERKIEEQAKQEKENQRKERQTLFAEREIKKATVKALEAKMVRMREFEKWETAHNAMNNSIQTKGKPHIFWRPKKMSDAAQEKWNQSKAILDKILEKKRQEVTSDLNAIEQRCIRNMKIPFGSPLRPTSLFDRSDKTDADNAESNSFDHRHRGENDDDDNNDDDDDAAANERVQRSSVVVKQERDDGDWKKGHGSSDVKGDAAAAGDAKTENGKAQSNEKWNRDDSDSSSDDNDHDDNSPMNDDKDHSMDETSRNNENCDEDPGGDKNTTAAASSSATT